ncbi:hypothetical protein DVDV_3720 [Desulfovibrio sp. DV]|uniref:hypothetical protein n=1 Tax=Desulfovibrio sp. DV TaxID=1844708 RepID=UPI00094BAE4B|nr:hypothetical protein [Desulfovibrio sp. DV]OLN25002.1 hypothetical protein DVDV_3720 [Desulfovibrio sp. DV]
MAQPMKLSFTQDVGETSPAKREAIGALRITADGRKFRYAKAASASIDAGSLALAPVAEAQHVNRPATPASVGERVVQVTVGASPVAENAYEDGYLQVADSDGQGRQYRILSNTACPAGGTVICTLAEPVRAALTTDSRVSLIPSPWCGVAASATEENLPAGVATCDVPAGHYFFAQTGGVGCCLAAGTAAVGSMLVPGAAPGSLAAMNATLDVDQPVAGVAFAAAFADGKHQPCLLTID